MIPAIAIISRLLCLQGTRGSFKYFPKNALLSFCRNMKSAVHVPCAGWLIFKLSCSALARTQDFKNFLSSSVLLQHLHHALIRFLISLLVCAVLYVVTFTSLFISSPECAHLSPNTCTLLFMFLHLILCRPSLYCIPHAIIECRMTILINYFPCLAARFSSREDCSIRPLAPIFAYLWIWDSLIWWRRGKAWVNTAQVLELLNISDTAKKLY